MEVTPQEEQTEVKERKKPGPKPKQKDEPVESTEQLFKLLTLKVDAVEIPYIIENKVEWRRIGPSQWTEDAQNTLFAYWRKRKEEDPKFDIDAKVKKLFRSE